MRKIKPKVSQTPVQEMFCNQECAQHSADGPFDFVLRTLWAFRVNSDHKIQTLTDKWKQIFVIQIYFGLEMAPPPKKKKQNIGDKFVTKFVTKPEILRCLSFPHIALQVDIDGVRSSQTAMSSVKVVNVKFLVHQTCRVAKAVKKQKGMYIRVYSTPLYCVILAKKHLGLLETSKPCQ